MELTPKQKAKELVNKYIPHIAGADRYNSTLGIYDKHISKQCALIAIDEIINSSPSLPILSDAGNFVNDIEESTEFWQEVKEELLKM